MENRLQYVLRKYIEYLEETQLRQSIQLRHISSYEKLCLRANKKGTGCTYYSAHLPGETKHTYLGNESNEEIGLIKDAHYLNKSLELIGGNLEACKKLQKNLALTDYDSINMYLPKIYRDATLRGNAKYLIDSKGKDWKDKKDIYKAGFAPWYPDDLIVRTISGELVRSKSEALIHNYYYERNVAFVYELPLQIEPGIILHPDFTLLSEIDYSTEIRLEHCGKYGTEKDRIQYNKKMHLYWRHGYIPGINIFYTFDDPRGGFDPTVLMDILDTRIRPK